MDVWRFISPVIDKKGMSRDIFRSLGLFLLRKPG